MTRSRRSLVGAGPGRSGASHAEGRARAAHGGRRAARRPRRRRDPRLRAAGCAHRRRRQARRLPLDAAGVHRAADVREARAGHFVVRLKGGDPFVFGRGGEEIVRCARPASTSTSCPASRRGSRHRRRVGIPVTHRGFAHGVALVTGHAAEGGEEPDWRALVASRLTLVVYMGMRRASELRATFVAAGMPATPVAIVANATRRTNKRSYHAGEVGRGRGGRRVCEPGDHRDRRCRRDARRSGSAVRSGRSGADNQMPCSTSSSARISGSSSRC